MRIRVKREDVFRCIASAEGWNAWFTRGSVMDFRPGGDLLFRWEDFGTSKGVVTEHGKALVYSPPDFLSFEWNPGGRKTVVTFELTPFDEDTLLTVEDEGYSAQRRDLGLLLECATGWGEALILLKFYAEHRLTY